MCHILINRLAYRFRGRFTVSAGNLSYFPIVFPIFLIVVYQLEAGKRFSGYIHCDLIGTSVLFDKVKENLIKIIEPAVFLPVGINHPFIIRLFPQLIGQIILRCPA